MPFRGCAAHRIYGLFERGDFGNRRTTVHRSGPLSFRWWDKRLELSLTRTPKRLYRRNDLSGGFDAEWRIAPATAVLRAVRKLEAALTPHRAPSREWRIFRSWGTIKRRKDGRENWDLRPQVLIGTVYRRPHWIPLGPTLLSR